MEAHIATVFVYELHNNESFSHATESA
jgi:hypothetical protein